MRSRIWLVTCVLCACRFHFDESSARDAQTWSAPMLVPGADTAMDEEDPTLSSDQTELYFTNSTIAANADVYVMTRASIAAPWSAPQAVSFNSNQGDGEGRLSPDDLTMYFGSSRPGGVGGRDIWSTTRTTIGGAWSVPVDVPSISSTLEDKWASLASDGHFVMVRQGARARLYEGVLGAAPPHVISELDDAAIAKQSGTFLTKDALTLYFHSSLTGVTDLYVTHRVATDGVWDPPTAIDELNSPNAQDEDPWVSDDGHTLVFSSNRSGSYDVYVSRR